MTAPFNTTALLQLEQSCFTHPYSKEQIDQMLGSDHYRVWFIDRKANVSALATDTIGYMIIQQNPAEASQELHRIGIVPEFRNKGMAKQLLTNWIASCNSNTVLLLEVAENNQPARHLYESVGFSIISRRRNYYPNGDDALLYRRMVEA